MSPSRVTSCRVRRPNTGWRPRGRRCSAFPLGRSARRVPFCALAAGHGDSLRAFIGEHGSLLVRGLGLRDAAETEAVFRQLGSLMAEREAFAPRRRYAEGVYSASKWPPNEHMCMHHELSYAVELPSPMLFACLVAPAVGREN